MRSNMTHENEKPDDLGAPDTEAQKRERVLLNWVIMLVGFGAIALAGIYLPVLL